MKIAVALLLYSTSILSGVSSVNLNRYFQHHDMTKIVDTEAFLAQLVSDDKKEPST